MSASPQRVFSVFIAVVVGCSKHEQAKQGPTELEQTAAEHQRHRPDALAVDPHAGHGGSGAAAPPEGHAEVTIPADRQQLINLKVAPAERSSFSGAIRASATVQTDETREAHVHTKLMGWVQELFVAAVGQRVTKGQPLYSLYSQELYATEQEYLSARSSAPELGRAARQRLVLWDVPESELRRIETLGAQKAVRFLSPIAGTVVEKSVVAGHYVDAGTMLYRIADLSRVWVLAEVYEYEVGRLDKGGTATVRVQGVDEPFSAKVDYVYPTVVAATRTVRVRLVLPNPNDVLRPGGFATVELPTTAVDAVTVPAEAVIDTGARQVVYVALPDGRFRPTAVQVGRRTPERVEIREGLRDGEQVVVSGQFLVDSESRLRGAAGPTKHGRH